MKKKRKDSQKHGVISIVQSPNKENNKPDNENKSEKDKREDESEGHGVISIVQAPDEARVEQP
jgi:hypothetical protein